jgi:hypothetical protein
MELTEELKKEIQRLYNETPDSIHGVSLGYKYKNGKKTDTIGIIFDVDKKISENDLSSDQILPKTIFVGGQEYTTDVNEMVRAFYCSCYCDTVSSCSSTTNSQITRLRNPSLLLPMRGGQEIIQYPTKWSSPSPGYYNFYLGTLGFFCVDNIDNKIVGVTNSHVVCNRRLYASLRDLALENSDVYNTFEPINFIFDSKLHNPGALGRSSSGISLLAKYIKRYMPINTLSVNYSDVALLVMDPAKISSTDSYKVWQPTGTADYTNFLPFASTSEIDNLLTTNPRLYSTGRTTGPKGYGNTSSCRLRVGAIGASSTVTDPGEADSIWGDLILFKYEDDSGGAILPGDSGSALLADISGVRKIVGLCFAGNGTIGLASRIDTVASEMNIRAWDGTYDTSIPAAINGIVTDPLNAKSSQASLVYGGKTYYQVGFTKTAGLPNVS